VEIAQSEWVEGIAALRVMDEDRVNIILSEPAAAKSWDKIPQQKSEPRASVVGMPIFSTRGIHAKQDLFAESLSEHGQRESKGWISIGCRPARR